MKKETGMFNSSAQKLVLAAALFSQGCSNSPSSELFGSYFPSWMICALIGIFAAVFVKIILRKAGIEEHIPLRVAVYPGFILAVTFFIWLVWFGN